MPTCGHHLIAEVDQLGIVLKRGLKERFAREKHHHELGRRLRAKSNVEGVVSDVSAKGQDAVDAVREVGDNMVDAIDQSLKHRPYTTLALAVGIGFLFGATWRR